MMMYLEKFREAEGSQFLSRFACLSNSWVCGDSIGQIHRLEESSFETMSPEGVTNGSVESAITAIAANPKDDDSLAISFDNTVRYRV